MATMMALLLPSVSAKLPHGCRYCDGGGFGGPQALGISPRRGPSCGGQTIRVEGTGLSGVSGVDILLGSTRVPCGEMRRAAENLLECVAGAATLAGEGQILLRGSCEPLTSAREPATPAQCIATRLRYSYEHVTLRSVSPAGGPPSGGVR